MKTKQIFLTFSYCAFLITGMAKLYTSFGDEDILATYDPLSGLRFKHLFAAAGSIEILTVMACITTQRMIVKAALLSWLCAMIVAYRIGLYWVGYKTPCSCLGSFTETLNLDAAIADNIFKGILITLALGSAVLLWRELTWNKINCNLTSTKRT